MAPAVGTVLAAGRSADCAAAESWQEGRAESQHEKALAKVVAQETKARLFQC